MHKNKISIVGTVGLPAKYGGFETLVENLVAYHEKNNLGESLVVYCSAKNYKNKQQFYKAAQLRYLPIAANGPQSILYDFVSIILSIVRDRADVILILGVSGALALPFARMFSNAKVITNIDGVEWKRGKWNAIASAFLRYSERIAVRYSHIVIADNQGIAEHVTELYGVDSTVIAYGGDHVLGIEKPRNMDIPLPSEYYFSVCRVEVENNLHVILEAFDESLANESVVIVGNWKNSQYGIELLQKYSDSSNIYLLDPIYDLGILRALRENCKGYVHGHSAGGTNPSLVEAMWFQKPIYCFNCNYNVHTTEGEASYFISNLDLEKCVKQSTDDTDARVGERMLQIAKSKYTWDAIASKYFHLSV